MSWNKNDLIPEMEIKENVTEKTVEFAKRFGIYLAEKEKYSEPLTTSQLRRFFGEVKRQQMIGYQESEFVMLKPKLAYAVGRAKNGKNNHVKIEDFYLVMADAIDKVLKSSDKQISFRNFISIFEAIVAYHKSAEKK